MQLSLGGFPKETILINFGLGSQPQEREGKLCSRRFIHRGSPILRHNQIVNLEDHQRMYTPVQGMVVKSS